MITDVGGVQVGHDTDPEGATGCTVILLPDGTTGAYALAGAAPGSRETDLLSPSSLVDEIHALVLTGGSAFGLAAADGVMSFLESEGRGFQFAGARVPIVPAAVIFDLGIGRPGARPDADAGARAARSAGREVAEGSVGAGTGATVGKWAGRDTAMKGGLGTASVRRGELVVGALVVCNALGDVLDEHGAVLAGSRSTARAPWHVDPGEATVIGAVVTNARLDKARATHVARMAASGISRAVRPAHTLGDGDLLFAAATNAIDADTSLVGALGAETVSEALRRGVRRARGLAGIPGLAG